MGKEIIALEIRPAEGMAKVGVAVQLNLFALDARKGTDLIPGNLAAWSSSDDRIGDVNRQGRLTPRHAGSVTITATYADKKASTVFTVLD